MSVHGYKQLCQGGAGRDCCLGVSGRSGRPGGLVWRRTSAHQQADTIYASQVVVWQALLCRTAIYEETDRTTVGYGG